MNKQIKQIKQINKNNNFLSNFNEKIVDFFKKNNIKHYNITSFGIILTACSLINLLYNEYILFVLLFFTAYCTNFIYAKYLEKYNDETQYTAYYFRFGDWLKLFTTFVIFTSLYKKKINRKITIIFMLLSLLYLINFIINMLTKNKNLNNNYRKQTNTKILNILYKKININSLEKIKIITRFFNETLTIIYILILMTYIHYK